MGYLTTQILNGISFGMLLFLVAAGFTIIFGLMRILNMAHGSFYLLGGYIGLSIALRTNNFLLAIIVGALSIGIVGVLMQYLLLQRNFSREIGAQVLLTIGVVFIFADLCLWIWGGTGLMIEKPEIFGASIHMGSTLTFPIYRLFVILVGVIVGILLWWFQERTKYGAIIRAGVDDREMSQGMGINIYRVNLLVFAMGALLAGFGGVIGSPVMGLYPGLDWEILIFAVVVVIIGGAGSLKGSFVGALLVGLANVFSVAFLPELSYFIIFAPMIVVLAIRPTGLFGTR